jgi:tRNA-2-methylthio-N6-dimethylallyladenosine synthase
MKVYLETMGCQMNRLDSELVAAQLRRAGHEMVHDRKAADVVLYNTCSVRRHAEEKVYSRLGADVHRKRHHRPRLILGVLGCMAQQEGEGLRDRFPEVDVLCAPGQLARLAELIDRAAAGSPGVALDPDRQAARRGDDHDLDALDLARDPCLTTTPQQAYVRVMKGCDSFCTYCVVPFVRGPERSREPARIVQEVRRLAEAGRTEITLLGQAVNRYRWRRDGPGRADVRFSDLLGRVAAVEGIRRVRFVTSHPLDFTDDVLQAMRDLPNVCPFIHCPPQSGSDAVLKRMNRKYTRAQYDDLLDRARRTVPGVVLAGDFIVGFPGETEADHAASADLIRRSGFKNSFVFKYSPRPGTFAASNLPDDVPTAVKQRRNRELLAVQREVGLAHHRGYVGQSVEVLVEGASVRADKQAAAPTPEATQLVGRTRGDHIVHFVGPRRLAGQYVHVGITDATALALLGDWRRTGGAEAR